jgi:hypothetical protein
MLDLTIKPFGLKNKMKQIDKLALIEIKDKKYFPPEVLKRQILYLW